MQPCGRVELTVVKPFKTMLCCELFCCLTRRLAEVDVKVERPQMLDPLFMVQLDACVSIKVIHLGISNHFIATDLAIIDYRLGRQPICEFADFFLNVFDGVQRIESVADDHDTAYGFRAALVQSAAAQGRSQGHLGDIFDINGHVVVDRNDTVLDIFNVLDKAKATDEIFRFINLNATRPDIDVRLLDGHEDVFDADPRGPHRVRIDVDLVFHHETADRGNFADAFR